MAPQPAVLKYSDAQLEQFLDRIDLPTQERQLARRLKQEPSLAKGETGLSLLKTIQLHCLSHIPYENLAFFTSEALASDLHPQRLFTQIVTNGRGAICDELGTFLCTVLTTLGYEAYTAAARLHNSFIKGNQTTEDWAPLQHVLVIVHFPDLDGKRYLVDIGMGTHSPTSPIELTFRDLPCALPALQTLACLSWNDMPAAAATSPSKNRKQSLVFDQGGWTYSIQRDGEWQPIYRFNATAYLQHDLESFRTKTIAPSSHLRKTAYASMLNTETTSSGEVRPVGCRVFYHKCVHQDAKVVDRSFDAAEFRTAMEKSFGIHLSEEETTTLWTAMKK